MALTLDGTGTAAPTIGGLETLAEVIGPKVAVVALSLYNHNGSQLTVSWQVAVSGNVTTVWSETFTVDNSVMDGYLSPPIPVYDQAFCNVALNSGADGADLAWDIYAL